MIIRISFSAPSKRREEDRTLEYRVIAVCGELCETVSEVEVLHGQSSDVWDEILREKELCCRI